jgi:hypothetical protein
MADYHEDGRAVAAAKILLTLRTRTLTQWPDWILPPPSKELASTPEERPSVETEAELPPLPEGWPKRPRDALRARKSGWSPSLDGLYARLLWRPAPARSGASSSEEERRAWSPPIVRKASRGPLSTRRSASGSGPSTSGAEQAARLRVSVKAVAGKEVFMAASSPETPFDYANAARSGASSSGDEGAKRKASRSGAPSSGDEGCSSPAKRTRVDVLGAAQPAVAAVKVEVSSIFPILCGSQGAVVSLLDS